MKHLLLSLLVFAFINTIHAAKVDIEDAKQIAVNAYFQNLNNFHEQVNFTDLTVINQFTLSRNGVPYIYAFNFRDYGFILISAEDALEPVIGYSTESAFYTESLPDNFMGLIRSYKDHIDYLRSNSVESSPQIREQWNELVTFKPETYAPKGGANIVQPLITNTWNQDWPYNYYCPLDPAGPGGRVYVGCVATTMSMLMHYWRYPHQGQGSKSYFAAPYGIQTANFGETIYDWDAMVDNTGSQINMDIALIGYHAAVAVSMNFGPYGSGASSATVPSAMVNYFKYSNNISYKLRSNYSLPDWKNIIKTDLDAKRPMYYAGIEPGASAGHAFILDGYNLTSDMYHFNFGWGGSMNGWFLVTNAGGFSNNQQLIHNIMPADPDYPYGCSSLYERNTLVGSFEDGSGPQLDYEPNANCSWLINPQTEMDSVTSLRAKFVFIDTDPNDIITIYDGETTDADVLGTYSGTSGASGWIYSSGNKMLVVFEANGDALTGAGWKMEYSSILPNFCQALTTFTAPTGTFDDGSGSFYYKNGTQCMWKIEPQWANGLSLTFVEFDTEEGADVLKVFNAANNQLIAEFSGDNLPDPVYVESGKLLLAFQTNGAINRPGWTVEYEVGNVGTGDPLAMQEDLKVFPNPASSFLNVSFNSRENTSFTLRLISVTGKVLYSETVNDFNGNYLNSIDLNEFSNGVYFINLITDSGTTTRKVIIR